MQEQRQLSAPDDPYAHSPAEHRPGRVGDVVHARLLRRSRLHPDHLVISQRAVSEPYLNRLVLGRELAGWVDRRVERGEYIVLLAPIAGVSREHFWVVTTGAAGLSLSPRQRVRVRVAQFDTFRWLVHVEVIVGVPAPVADG